MQFIFITNQPDLAKLAQDAGVDRIMVDLEVIGKSARQGHLDTLISRHSLEDIIKLRRCLSVSELVVRCNPIHTNSAQEIETILGHGADRIMLPMFKTHFEVDHFLNLVDGRAKTCLLLETAQALVRIDEILEVPGIDEVHIGLNDLHLSLGLDFMFELLSGGVVEYVVRKVQARGIPTGIGGISRLGTGQLDASLVLSEYVRLGSQVTILSRSFHNQAASATELSQNINLRDEIIKLRELVQFLEQASLEVIRANQLEVSRRVRTLVNARNC